MIFQPKNEEQQFRRSITLGSEEDRLFVVMIICRHDVVLVLEKHK